MVHVLLKPGLENFKHYFTNVWDECNCAAVWAFFGIAFLWNWNENWCFPVLWPLLSFPNLLAYWVQHFHSIIFQDFPVSCDPHSQGFGIVHKAEIDVFLELSCFFNDPADIGNLISGSSAFSKSSLNIWKFMVCVLLKPGLENFEHYFSVWDKCNCVVVWAFFGIAFLWDWNENWPFPVLWPLLSFKIWLRDIHLEVSYSNSKNMCSIN